MKEPVQGKEGIILVLVLVVLLEMGVGNPSTPNPSNPPTVSAKSGRALFLKNCAHCHGADASGDEGPDLHDLDWTDRQIADRIRNGKKGQMTAFAGKLQTNEIESLIAYLRTLSTNSPARN